MNTQFIRDIGWLSKRYGELYLTEEQIADYLRCDLSEVQELASQGKFGEQRHKTSRARAEISYNLFDVVFYALNIDNALKDALELYMLTSAENAMKEKKGKRGRPKKSLEERIEGLKPRDRGRYELRVCTPLGNITVGSKDKAELLLKAKQAELELQQIALLKEVESLTPEEAKKLSVTFDKLKQTSLDPEKKRATKKTKEKPAPTFGEVFKMWWKETWEEGNLKQSTLTNYDSRYRRHIGIHQGFISKPVDEITNKDVGMILNSVADKNVVVEELNCVKRLIVEPLKHIYLLTDEIEEYEDLKLKVDFDKINLRAEKLRKRLPTEKKKEAYALSGEQKRACDRVLNSLIRAKPTKKARYYLLRLNFSLGLRMGELAALTEDCVNLKDREITVKDNEVIVADFDENYCRTGKRKVMVTDPKTHKGTRTLSLSDEACAILEDLMAYRKRNKIKVPALASDGTVARCYRDSISNAYRNMNTCLDEENFGFHVHMQRDFIATGLIDDGQMDRSEVADFMGHSSPETTMRIYAKKRRATKEKQIASLNAVL